MVHAKHKFFLKDLSSIFENEEARIALEWERNAVRELITEHPITREDAAWYRDTFIEGFCFLYDTSIYDRHSGQYTLDAFLDDGEREFGGYDLLLLWQPFPRIGFDPRNQFDFWRDMPGGLDGLRALIDCAHARGVRCLLNYIPWDTGTPRGVKSDAQEIGEIALATGADGIFGDTMSGFSQEFRDELRGIAPHLILESESIPPFERLQHQEGVWVQDIVLKPLLVPLPRWITPAQKCFAVDRQVSDRRSLINWAFFMGMGLVVWENVFGWWNPFAAADRALIRRIKPLLQAHADAFAAANWLPLPVDTPGLYANCWKTPGKIVITLLNTTPERIYGASIVVSEGAGHFGHYDVWNGCVLETRFSTGAPRLARMLVDVDAHSIGCVVIQPTDSPAPEYAPLTESSETRYRTHTSPTDHLPRPVVRTAPAAGTPSEMIAIPAADYRLRVYDAWVYNEGGCYDFPGDYGNFHRAQEISLPAYLIDRTEVTNQQYHEFLRASDYQPREYHNFLKHWQKPVGADSDPRTWLPPVEKDNHPVVWVDLEDARAYCQWAGKRLPTEAEWQYAAQGTDQRRYPWGEQFSAEFCNHAAADTTAVDAYPAGASPFGCLDMCGNVWEWTESERDDGHTRYAILKSGSHWIAEGSLWYVASGAQPCSAHQKILLLYPGLDRCATVGFRAVRDL